jgi:hypothetical protein
MRAFLLFFSIVVAFLSIAYKDSILTTIESLTNTNISTTTFFEGLPLIPPRAIYGEPKPANMSVPRAIRKAFLAIEQSEGVGARVRRSIGTPQLRNFSPFLMLDHFSSSPGAGFPDHPHRGLVCPGCAVPMHSCAAPQLVSSVTCCGNWQILPRNKNTC